MAMALEKEHVVLGVKAVEKLMGRRDMQWPRENCYSDRPASHQGPNTNTSASQTAL